MAYLKKLGKYYYAKWRTSINGNRQSVRKSLGTRHKDVAQKMLRELEKLECLGKHEVAYSPDIEYSGLKGKNLIYEDDKLAYIELPVTKGRKERPIPIIRSLRGYLEEYFNPKKSLDLFCTKSVRCRH